MATFLPFTPIEEGEEVGSELRDGNATIQTFWLYGNPRAVPALRRPAFRPGAEKSQPSLPRVPGRNSHCAARATPPGALDCHGVAPGPYDVQVGCTHSRSELLNAILGTLPLVRKATPQFE